MNWQEPCRRGLDGPTQASTMTDLRKNFAGGLSRCEVGELVSDIGGDLVDKEDSYLVAERG